MLQPHMIEQAPDAPGVYTMYAGADTILYVGKAKSLIKRLRSYLASELPVKIARMVSLVERVEYVQVFNENEAFILENTLIKQHQPRYNTLLRDDKTYPFIRIDFRHPYPRMTVVRKIKPDGARYFGPFVHGSGVFRLFRLLEHIYKLRSCSDTELQKRSKPCIEHEIGNCLAPCVFSVKDTYQAELMELVDFFRGKSRATVQRMEDQMKRAAATLDFERAAEIRDRLASIHKVINAQMVLDCAGENIDVYYLEKHPARDRYLASILIIRDGKLSGSYVKRLLSCDTDAEAVAAILREYMAGLNAPDLIVSNLPLPQEEQEHYEAFLKHQRIDFRVPQRGKKVRYLELAQVNLEKHGDKQAQEEASELMQRLGLAKLERMECYDISAFQGSYPIGSMSVWKDGELLPSAYRLFRLEGFDQNDDYLMIARTLQRRFQGSLASESHPDLILIDGGASQLNMAQKVLEELALGIAVISISKGRSRKSRGQESKHYDEIHIPGRKNPIAVRGRSVYRVLQHLRDEAHRFGITAHSRGRDRESLTSSLLAIPGIGPKSLQKILATFSSYEDILQNQQQLEALCGDRVASALVQYLQQHAEPSTPPHEETP
ncbi:excinuclease ABC, C subunit [Desulfurispirillum indicum S5]|uniref:UvrABC system protein C n=1 Tax=Desulfurispirillum indicum (strain ATCC BAA-1389 / DSM 22839 / S5) TaxID=653733 RepID=E6W3X6_DESIS|nr:excinuclease ABC subunit UvrC [Desulfurispirillum indicum]ADU65844.1 excinuclease ABC, C subunit [Desulfurispirillum indicum S5]